MHVKKHCRFIVLMCAPVPFEKRCVDPSNWLSCGRQLQASELKICSRPALAAEAVTIWAGLTLRPIDMLMTCLNTLDMPKDMSSESLKADQPAGDHLILHAKAPHTSCAQPEKRNIHPESSPEYSDVTTVCWHSRSTAAHPSASGTPCSYAASRFAGAGTLVPAHGKTAPHSTESVRCRRLESDMAQPLFNLEDGQKKTIFQPSSWD